MIIYIVFRCEFVPWAKCLNVSDKNLKAYASKSSRQAEIESFHCSICKLDYLCLLLYLLMWLFEANFLWSIWDLRDNIYLYILFILQHLDKWFWIYWPNVSNIFYCESIQMVFICKILSWILSSSLPTCKAERLLDIMKIFIDRVLY